MGATTNNKNNKNASNAKEKKVPDVEIINLEDPERDNWGGQLEFILTLVGFAVGLGNVWRFPYLVYENGGGAFLIPYFLMLFFVGLPLFFLETSFGQFASLGPITAYKFSPALKGVGIAGVVVASYICIYYNVIVAWCLFYFFASWTTELPWDSCNNWWNSPNCIEPEQNLSMFSENATLSTASEEYYYDYVLRITDGIEDAGVLRWQLVLCLLMAWITIFLVLIKGIASLGKAAYFVSLFPYVLLTIMLIRGVTLPGAALGIEYYLKPDWSRLTEAKVWADAATQIFYSLGISHGLIAMASFNKFHNNILRDALIIPFVNCFTSVYAGFVIFSVLGYMAELKGVPVSEVAAEGPGLIFVVYPEGLSTMPFAPVWSILFFFMMVTLGFSSQFSTAEGVVSAFIDEFPVLGIGNRPTYCRITLCTFFFLLGLPMVTEGGFYLFNIMDIYAAGYTLLIVAFLELMGIMYVYGYHRYAEDMALMLGHKPGLFWEVTWRWVSPGIIILVFISKGLQQSPLTFEGYVYPRWANGLGWGITIFPCLVILGVFIYVYCDRGGYEVLQDVTDPMPTWGPARAKDRTGRYALPKDEDDTVEVDLPPYWHAVKLWTGSTADSYPPSYANDKSMVKSVSEAVAMDTYTVDERKQRDDLAEYTYVVDQPLYNSTKQSSTPRSDEHRNISGSDHGSSGSSTSTKVEVYAVPKKLLGKHKSSATGVANEAFVADDVSITSRDSSTDESPVATAVREEMSSAL